MKKSAKNSIKNLKQKKLAIVLSVFNKDIALRLKKGAKAELKKHKNLNVKWAEAPGAIEIPLTAQWLFQKNYQTVIVLGAIIKGETSHYTACCQMAQYGCMKVQLKAGRPLIFGLLMTDNKEQALARSGGKKGNIAVQALRTALKMLDLKNQI